MSSAAKVAYQQVYVGTWINWSYGSINGATLTLSSRTGTLLVAFLALYVAWSGRQLWSLICYLVHQWRSTPAPRDALHHQQQVLLRLGAGDFDFLWKLVKTTWIWKKNKSTNIARRQGPLMVVAAIHCTFIFVASVLTSRLADSAGEVLLQSPICGWPDISVLQLVQQQMTALPGADAFYVTANWFYGASREYSRECYTQTALLGSSTCNYYTKSTIDSHIRFDDPCPFQDTMCTTPAVTIDTGIVDSHQDLGMNGAQSNRIQFRKLLSCAIIPADQDFSSEWTTNSTSPMFPWDPVGSGGGIAFKYYYLGPQTLLGLERPSTFWLSNVSNAHEKQYEILFLGSFIDDPVATAFRPIPQLNRTDADITLIGLRNRALYTYPVNDPFFKATSHRADYSGKFFSSDLDVGMIGCTEQYQFCNGRANCSILNALGPSPREAIADSLGYNDAQRALFATMWRTAYHMRMFNVLFMLEDTALLAKDLIYGEFGVSTGLPNDQWQREVQNLHNISLAALQESAVAHMSPPNLVIGSGTNSSHSYDWIKQENSTAQRQICQNQKIKMQDFYSFNILSLALVIITGFFVILIGSVAPLLTDCYRRKEHRNLRPSSSQSSIFEDTENLSSYRAKEWKCSDTLHLHRLALEGHGIAPWTETDSVPVPFDPQKLFRIPWLTEWPGKTFFIDRISVVF